MILYSIPVALITPHLPILPHIQGWLHSTPDMHGCLWKCQSPTRNFRICRLVMYSPICTHKCTHTTYVQTHAHELGFRALAGPVPALPLTSCVALGKLLYLSGLQMSSLRESEVRWSLRSENVRAGRKVRSHLLPSLHFYRCTIRDQKELRSCVIHPFFRPVEKLRPR